MTRIYYVLEYRAGDDWFSAMDGDGHTEHYDNVTHARAKLMSLRQGTWRIVKVEEIRTPL